MIAQPELSQLLAIMARLRDPNGGCPWDLEQNFSTIAPYTLEEAYEVADAIASGDMENLKEELGDLLFQVVFHSQMAAEQNAFTFADVVQSINEKMIRRHPHVFADATIQTAQAQVANWESIKAAERAAKPSKTSLLENVPAALPALVRAQKLQSRAARAGFDWPNAAGVIAKIREELAEVEEAMAGDDKAHQAEELGDLLFAVSNLARFMDTDAENTLRAANAKFTRRFQYIETALTTQGRTLQGESLEALESLWREAKETGL